MVGIGIIGIGYAQQVLIPAFRLDNRCKVRAVAASTYERAQTVAQKLDIEKAYGDWRDLIADPSVDAVTVAVPPTLQPEIACAAAKAKKHLFLEKPLAATLEQAEAMAADIEKAEIVSTLDFCFPEIFSWQQLEAKVKDGSVGPIRSVDLRWMVETYANLHRLENWKSRTADGGGSLNNFLSHSFYYLERLFGPISEVTTKLSAPPHDVRQGDSVATLALVFKSGLCASVAMNAAAFGERVHRLSVFGENGTLVLENTTSDYIRGFSLIHHPRDGAEANHPIVDHETETYVGDARLVTASRIIGRFIDAIESGIDTSPNIQDGLRVQILIDAAKRADLTGRRISL